MPRVVHDALTAVSAKALATKGKVGRYADGAGLYLVVVGPGRAKWSFRFMLAGQAREAGLGAAFRRDDDGKVVPDVSLKEARAKADAIRQQVKRGIDPIAAKEAEEAARRALEDAQREAELAVSDARSFRAAFDGWLEAHGAAFKTERQRVQARQLMERHVLPHIGAKPVADVTTNDMHQILKPIWRKLPETALRVRIRCESVLAWAKGSGWRQGENPAVWRDNLAPLLGRQGADARAEHHKAMHWRDVPAFMKRLEAETSTSALAMRWTIMTAARTAETLGATWGEIDMHAPGGPVWVIPADRMKMGVEHRVPLSRGALAVLEAARKLRVEDPKPGDHIFPGAAGTRGGRVAGGRPGAVGGGLSNMALLTLLRRLKVAGTTTTHGFRSSFRSWCAEATAAPEAVAEAALAHRIGNEVQRAYQRSDLLEKRRALMEAWCDHITRPAADVVPLVAARA